MLDTEPGAPRSADDDLALPAPAPDPPGEEEEGSGLSGLKDDLTALAEDARTYAAAEIVFQKTRAALAGKAAARVAVYLVLALVLLNLALIALAVGAVIALAPLVTIWGAIGIVVGVLLAGTVFLVMRAAAQGKLLGAMFGGEEGA
ncbi:phage holin family protein [Erythrobacter sp. NE805]|uniref:phage holin family protein n=1 Tax=Erythrobacter sp. NE805 TaxID=3389875 RepID=UPI00396B125E